MSNCSPIITTSPSIMTTFSLISDLSISPLCLLSLSCSSLSHSSSSISMSCASNSFSLEPIVSLSTQPLSLPFSSQLSFFSSSLVPYSPLVLSKHMFNPNGIGLNIDFRSLSSMTVSLTSNSHHYNVQKWYL